MTELPQTLLRFADLSTKRSTQFEVKPDAALRKAIAAELDLIALKKCHLLGEIEPLGQHDWALRARLGATVVQPCVITLEPVSTRIDEDIARRYVADLPEIEAGEVEMPEDDTLEPLPAALALMDLLKEALALVLPLYPRAEGASLGQVIATQPGQDPMTDEQAKPFAALASLKQALEKTEE